MKNYADFFKHPRWQKKRLEIFERDNFTCTRCESKDVTLNVHHMYYKKNAKPWDYENQYLVTLCEECHKEETDLCKQSVEILTETVKKTCFSGGVHSLACLMNSINENGKHEPSRLIGILERLVVETDVVKIFELHRKKMLPGIYL